MGKQKIENNFNLKEKLLIRIFLAIFIISIFAWIIPSTIGFINLSENRVHELPEYIQDMSPFGRAIIILISVQLPYFLIALGLFAEFSKPNIIPRYNKNKFLTFVSIILLTVGVFTLFWNWILTGFDGPIYDTIIYGIGFGILFLLVINSYSIWLKILLWTRLIEVWGPLVGHNVIPAFFGKYTGGAFGHFGYGWYGMISSPYFWTDFIVQIFSVIGVMYLLKKAGYRWFWIISFSIGAIIVGVSLSFLLSKIF